MTMQMHSCPQCAAEFDTFESLEHHLRTAHSEVLVHDKYRCTTCDAEFLACSDWARHVDDEHPGETREVA
jgi:uncharacterized C2H2 Zn-finger protein